MGKTIVYIVLLALLGFGVYYFLFRNTDALYKEAEANFTIRDTAAIGKIFLARNDGESVLLERTADGWTVNKKYIPMRRPLLNLLTCLNKQTALYPVAEKDRNKMVQYLSGNAIKVEVYDLKGEKIRTFYVVGIGPDYHGSYMMMEGASTPYLVEVPGFSGYLTPRFTTDINDWRSRIVFDLSPEKIKSVRVAYEDEPLNSFTILKDKEKTEVIVHPDMESVAITLNKKRVESYLGFFQNVNCEGYLNGTLGMDSIIATAKKRCAIDITRIDGGNEHVDIYWMGINRRSKNIKDYKAGVIKTPYDIDRMYAVMHDSKDTAVIQMRTFDKFFRRAYEFYQAEDTTKTVPQEEVRALMLK